MLTPTNWYRRFCCVVCTDCIIIILDKTSDANVVDRIKNLSRVFGTDTQICPDDPTVWYHEAPPSSDPKHNVGGSGP